MINALFKSKGLEVCPSEILYRDLLREWSIVPEERRIPAAKYNLCGFYEYLCYRAEQRCAFPYAPQCRLKSNPSAGVMKEVKLQISSRKDKK
jgi:hypothetical protein